jgi:hypothetical protein
MCIGEMKVMRQMISGLLAAIALTVIGAVPAMACGDGVCCGVFAGPCVQSYGYTGCAAGCGWGFDRLADPETQYHSVQHAKQYYYVNQGPTYTGPGAFAPYPTYREAAASGYRWQHHYHFRPWRQRHSTDQARPVLRSAY